MAKIEGFRIRNFRTLCDVALGRLWNDKGTGELGCVDILPTHIFLADFCSFFRTFFLCAFRHTAKKVQKNLLKIISKICTPSVCPHTLAELDSVLDSCHPKPNAVFCLAIEEFEAWYLGDLDAVRKAYPRAKNNVLSGYKNDSICGTWEVLANAVYKGGSKALNKKGWQAALEQKSIWAKTISPHMDVDANASPSFNEMRNQLRSINA